jgi:hypothetical protein
LSAALPENFTSGVVGVAVYEKVTGPLKSAVGVKVQVPLPLSVSAASAGGGWVMLTCSGVPSGSAIVSVVVVS